MEKIRFGDILFSERIEREIFASDQPIDEYTLVEVLADDNKDSVCRLAVCISYSYYDVHAFGYDRFTITFSQFQDAMRDLKKFQKYFSCGRIVHTTIENIITVSKQQKPYLMYVEKLNKMLLTDRDFASHIELFERAKKVGEEVNLDEIGK